MFDRITLDPRIMGGRACIRGMRIPVSAILGQIAHCATCDEIQQDYSDLDREDLEQALEYAARLTQGGSQDERPCILAVGRVAAASPPPPRRPPTAAVS
jgi:uncharacterized protein (DUF433 family)